MTAGDGMAPDPAEGFEPWMRLALELAAWRPEPGPHPGEDVPVGALVLSPDRQVLGRGRNRCLADRDPTAHAEVVAIREAGRSAGNWRLDGCTLVVTLEPCTMCAGAIRAARLSRLVYGAPDERAGAVGSLWDVVRDYPYAPAVEVIPGVLAGQSAELLRDFFARRR